MDIHDIGAPYLDTCHRLQHAWIFRGQRQSCRQVREATIKGLRGGAWRFVPCWEIDYQKPPLLWAHPPKTSAHGCVPVSILVQCFLGQASPVERFEVSPFLEHLCQRD